MIGFLQGTVKLVSPGKIILTTGGVGFNVFVPTSLNVSKDQKIELYVHTHMREDNIALYGFENPNDLEIFELLLTVSGVGPKIALTMLSSSTNEKIKNAISESNLAFFASITGIGKKTAQKIILDLKSKIDKVEVNMENLQGNSDLIDSLKSLGFEKREISAVYSKIDSSLTLPEQVKSALKLLKK